MSTATEQPYWHLTLKCPHCEAKGMISWDRLKADRRLYCRRCERWYRVSGQGKLLPAAAPEKRVTVSVRSSFSAWIDYHRNARFGRRSVTDPRFWGELIVASVVWLLAARTGMRMAVAAVAVTMFAVGWLAFRSGPAVAVAPSEPTTLAERAPIFAEAWACSDLATMMHFTLPQEADQLKYWMFAEKRPPALLEVESGEVTATAISVVPQQDPHQAVVMVGVAARSPAGNHAENPSDYQQREIWTERDGQWYFSPKETAAKLLPAAGASFDPRNFVPVSPLSRH
jgi:hypothetical protein